MFKECEQWQCYRQEFYDRNGDIKVLEQTGPKTYTTFGTGISPKSYRGFADYLEAYLKSNKIYDENIWLTSDEILNKFAGIMVILKYLTCHRID